jgi:DNA-binding MarR family transcriptional regulator
MAAQAADREAGRDQVVDRLLNDLETAGLIERRRDVDDRRRHIVVLTEAGGLRLREAERR